MTEFPAPPQTEPQSSSQAPQAGYPAPPPPGYAPPANYGPGGYGSFQLPPGVEIASVGRRIGAYFLALPLMIVTLVIGYLIWGAVAWGKGTSPALKVLGMRCVDADTGQPVGWGKMAMRDIVGGIVGALFGIMYIVSFVMFLTGERHQSVPDKIGGTVVVHDPNKVMG